MTVSYNLDVSIGSWRNVFRVFLRWRGSIYKLIWKELMVWMIAYYAIMYIYRADWILTEAQMKNFELLAHHIGQKIDRIPLTFILGFFVSMVVDRWRQIFSNMGFIENVALTVNLVVKKEKRDRIARRSIIRWLVLSQVMVFRDISVPVRRRFPTEQSLVDAGFLEENELRMLKELNMQHNKYWLPINWACTLIQGLRDDNRIGSEVAVINLLNEIRIFRTNLALLCNFDWVPVPLAYPQVVFLSVRVYFCLCLIARQYIIGEDALNRSVLDILFPFMTILQFIFYVGWMKVAESLLNPLGEDDDHFECNFLIDKNIETGFAIVDETMSSCPAILSLDRFATDPSPTYPTGPPTYEAFVGSAAHLVLPVNGAPKKKSIEDGKRGMTKRFQWKRGVEHLDNSISPSIASEGSFNYGCHWAKDEPPRQLGVVEEEPTFTNTHLTYKLDDHISNIPRPSA